MTKNQSFIKTSRNVLADWLYIAGSMQDLDSDIQNRLNPNTQKVDPTYYIWFNDKYQVPLIKMGKKRKLFSSNEDLMATIRRIYNQLSKAKNQIDKQYAKDLRYVYENPSYFKQAFTDWYTHLLSVYNPQFLSEKIQMTPSKYAKIGYYIREPEIEAVDLFSISQRTNKMVCDTLYQKWCNCIKSLFRYYNAIKYYDRNYTKSSDNPLEISILLCFTSAYYQEWFFNITFHKFGDLTEYHNQLFKLKKWLKNKQTNNKPDEITDENNPETPDLEELTLKWSRPICLMSSQNNFMERKNEIGKRLSNYIYYD